MKKRIVSIVIVALLLLFVSTPAFFNGYSNQSLSQAPVILVVGDFSNEEAFGSVVYHGANEALQKDSRNGYPQIDIHMVNVNDSAWEDAFAGSNTPELQTELNLLHQNLLQEVVGSNVVAIICANTSQTVNKVLEVGKAFNIPVLVTVSTTAGILKGYESIAFRLIASDKKQAEAITTWSANSRKRIALLYDSSRYGIGLRNSLINSAKIGEMLPFPLNTTTDTGGIIRYASDEKVEAWIIVGYRNQSREFLSKLQASNTPGSVLFSDGAYGLWLEQIQASPRQEFFLSFPAITVNTYNGPGKDLKGYSVFGFDAVHLICRTIAEMKKKGQEKKYLLAAEIRGLAPRMQRDGFTRLEYSFDQYGENETASFSITKFK